MLEGIDFMVKTNHKPLTYASNKKTDKTFHAVYNEDWARLWRVNKIIDGLSTIESILLPSDIDTQFLAVEQIKDMDLQDILSSGFTFLQLLPVTLGCYSIYWGTPTPMATIIPFIPETLRKTAFGIFHRNSHSNSCASYKLT